MQLSFSSTTPVSFRSAPTTRKFASPRKRWRTPIWHGCTPSVLARSVRVEVHNDDDKLPTLVYLPGLDSRPLPPHQHVELRDSYRTVSILLRPGDSREWDALADSILAAAPAGDFVLVGESFGAALALRVAARGGARISRLVLLNPGTAFSLSPLARVAARALPVLAVPNLYRIASRLLTPFLISRDSVHPDVSLIDNGGAVFDVDETPLPDVLHRVGLLQRFEDDFSDKCITNLIKSPTILVASAADLLLPSVRESIRLKRILSNVEQLIILPDASHAALLDKRFKLEEFLGCCSSEEINGRGSSKSRSYDERISDSEYANAYKTGTSFFAPWRSLTSPWVGDLEYARSALELADDISDCTRPVLFVGNHGKYGILDLSLLYKVLADELANHVDNGGGGARRLRGLADASHFIQWDKISGGQWAPFVRALGAVPTSARAFYTLLRHGERILLFPGAAREVCRRRGEEYTMVWGDDTEFVRPAAKFNAIIVPFACVGADDDAPTLLDGQELQRIPGFGPVLQRAIDNAGFDRQHVFPVSAPPRFNRYYFKFFPPIDTREIDSSDAVTCSRTYEDVKSIVRDGMKSLVAQRANDPKRTLLQRVASVTLEQFDF